MANTPKPDGTPIDLEAIKALWHQRMRIDPASVDALVAEVESLRAALASRTPETETIWRAGYRTHVAGARDIEKAWKASPYSQPSSPSASSDGETP